MEPIGLYALASRHADWVETRQNVAARNIANVNTPDYQPREVVPFQKLINGPASTMQTSHPLHFKAGLTSGDDAVATQLRTDEFGRAQRTDLQGEMLHASGIKSAYELNTAILKTFNRLFLTVTRTS